MRAGSRSHDVMVSGEIAARWLSGRVEERPVIVSDTEQRTVRTVEFGPAAAFGARDRPLATAIRDVWQVSPRVQIEGGARVDHSRHGGGAPSGRAGVRYMLDPAGKTVLKAGYGSFIGTLPLTAPAFASYPVRSDRWLDAPWLLNWLSRRAAGMDAAELGALTVSTLRGEEGRQQRAAPEREQQHDAAKGREAVDPCEIGIFGP